MQSRACSRECLDMVSPSANSTAVENFSNHIQQVALGMLNRWEVFLNSVREEKQAELVAVSNSGLHYEIGYGRGYRALAR